MMPSATLDPRRTHSCLLPIREPGWPEPASHLRLNVLRAATHWGHLVSPLPHAPVNPGWHWHCTAAPGSIQQAVLTQSPS